MASTHYGCHAVSGAALIAAIDAAIVVNISGLHLVSIANGTQIAVIGVV